MKVQYLGDVNDFRKYSLLRLLAGAGLKIGVNWLLTPNDGRPDGNKRTYLAQPKIWRPCDPVLFDLLVNVPQAPKFDDFRQIEQHDIIPGAVYFDEIVPVGIDARKEFHAMSMGALAPCDLVFFDPDNGLATASVSKSRTTGVKFVFDDELADHYQAGRSLLVYQHFPRVERTRFIRELNVRLRDFAPDCEIWACNTPQVVFMLMANPSPAAQHNGVLSAAIEIGRNRWPESFIKFDYLPKE